MRWTRDSASGVHVARIDEAQDQRLLDMPWSSACLSSEKKSRSCAGSGWGTKTVGFVPLVPRSPPRRGLGDARSGVYSGGAPPHGCRRPHLEFVMFRWLARDRVEDPLPFPQESDAPDRWPVDPDYADERERERAYQREAMLDLAKVFCWLAAMLLVSLGVFMVFGLR